MEETIVGKPKILFVDDEPAILDGLRNLLRKKRHIWDMHFTDGPAKALDILSRERFDVVVSDMRMPEMDGAALFEKIRKRYPGTVRIILSGHMDPASIMRAVPVVHRFLSKPCDPDLLQQTVERTLNLQRKLSDERVINMLGGVDRLPVLPQVYHELSALMADENSSAAQVAKVVEKDPGISAKLLQLVNSAFFGLPLRITSIERAVTQLGMSTINGLVVSSAIFDLFIPDNGKFSLVDFQNHALVTGQLARQIATKSKDDAFIGGLLHDLGKLILLKQQPDDFYDIQQKQQQGTASWHELEQKKLGCTHCELGACLLDLWGIPETIVESVACHHYPDDLMLGEFELPAAVFLANELAHGRMLPEKHTERWGLKNKAQEYWSLAEKLSGKGK